MVVATENPPKLWTTEDLLAMPDDGVERWIIKGQLREQPSEFPEVKLTVRNRHHSRSMSYVAATLVNWLRTQLEPRGDVYTGEAGVRLQSPFETTVGWTWSMLRRKSSRLKPTVKPPCSKALLPS